MDAEQTSGGVAADRLRAFFDRLEKLDDERKDAMALIKDVYAEAKAEGFDVKTMRALFRLLRMKPHERTEQEELLAIYKTALGIS